MHGLLVFAYSLSGYQAHPQVDGRTRRTHQQVDAQCVCALKIEAFAENKLIVIISKTIIENINAIFYTYDTR